MEEFDKYYDFMCEYADFLEDVQERQMEKFKVFIKANNAKQLDQVMEDHVQDEDDIRLFEEERLELHAELGLEGMSFRDVIESCEDPEQKNLLNALFIRIKTAVEQSKYFNEKAVETAQECVNIVNTMSEVFVDAPTYTKDGVQKNKATKLSFIDKTV